MPLHKKPLAKDPCPTASRWRRGLALLLLAAMPYTSWADLIPPQAQAAAQRLRDNPQSFDRTDNYCQDRKPGAACTIAGSRLAGGGEGVCENRVNSSLGSIDLLCRRSNEVSIDRGLPEGGFVADSDLCKPSDTEAWEGKRPWNCRPLKPAPADRFCRDQAVGASCVVSLRYQGQLEQQTGVCKTVTEEEGFYYMGRRVKTREVIRCEAVDAPAPRSWIDATVWQKLRQ